MTGGDALNDLALILNRHSDHDGLCIGFTPNRRLGPSHLFLNLRRPVLHPRGIFNSRRASIGQGLRLPLTVVAAEPENDRPQAAPLVFAPMAQ